MYCVGILDFVFEEDKNDPQFLHTVQLKDDNCRVYYDKHTFVFIEMSKFNKTEEQLETHFDKWLYLIRKLNVNSINNLGMKF